MTKIKTLQNNLLKNSISECFVAIGLRGLS